MKQAGESAGLRSSVLANASRAPYMRTMASFRPTNSVVLQSLTGMCGSIERLPDGQQRCT